jgi:DNA repair ATPase RecN
MQENLAAQIAQVKQRLAEAKARVPKHDIPAALIAEIDELDQELERLQALADADPIESQIAELEQRLAEAKARIPKHDVPAALIAEMDELDEELERLRALRDKTP